MVEDFFLVLVLAGLLALYPGGALAVALAAAIPAVVGWSLLTLHRPTRVDIDDDGIAFSAYGRAHRFDWSRVERLHVRRFAVRDRVLVRISPAPPLSGRYWLLDSLEGYAPLVQTLEKRAKALPLAPDGAEERNIGVQKMPHTPRR
jgi:hypothetical protein